MISVHGCAIDAARKELSLRRILLSAVVLAFALHLSSPAANADAAVAGYQLPKLGFATPRTVVLAGDSRTVVVKTPANFSKLRVTVSGHDLSKRARRISARRVSIPLRRGKDVSPGSNHLIVSLRAKGAKRRSIGSTRVIVLRKASVLRSVAVSGASRTLKLQLRREPFIFSVALNGRGVGNLISHHLPTLQTAKLSPDDGLKIGRNVLTVRAIAKDGSHSSRHVVFNVTDTRPLAAASHDRALRTGSTVRLSGRRTAHRGKSVTYRWRIAKAPAKSHAKLRGSGTSRPRLTPDVNGRYEIELTARALGRSAKDVVEVEARPVTQPMGIALDTAATLAGGGYSIRLGGGCGANQQGCAPTDYAFGANAVELLLVDRDTLEVQSTQGFDGSAASAATVASKLKTIGGQKNPDVFGILAAKPGASTDRSWTNAIKQLSGKNADIGNSQGWSSVGVPLPDFNGADDQITGVTNAGEAPESGYALGEQRGWFQWDSIGQRFAYMSGRYSSYDTASGGDQVSTNTMTIDGKSYSSAPLDAGCSGGFQVVTLRAISLAAVSSIPENQTFSTNCSSSSASVNGATNFLVALNLALDPPSPPVTDGPAIVFVQSIGQPSSGDANLRAVYYQASTFVEQLGGQAEVFNRAMTASDTRYALVGGSDVVVDEVPDAQSRAHGAEATALHTPSGATLAGILRGNHLWHYEPVTATGNGMTGATLAPIVYQQSQPWPTGSTAGEANALAYLSKLYGLQYSAASSCYEPVKPDVRFEFCDLTGPWSKVSSQAASLPYNSACGCSTTEWTAVTADIAQEAGWVVKIEKWVSEVQKLYGGPGSAKARIGLEGIGNTINQAINPPAGSGAAGWWTDLVSNIFNVAALLPEEDAVEDVLAAISGIGYLAEDALTTPDGVSSLGAIVNETAADLPGDLANKYLAASERLGTVGEMLVSDYGKLKAAGSSTLVQVDDTALNNATSTMIVGAYRFGYAKMLNSAYSSYALMPNSLSKPGLTDPTRYGCPITNQFGMKEQVLPFASNPAGTWLTLNPNNPLSPFFNDAAPLAFALGEKGESGSVGVDPPPSGVLPNLFNPITFDSTGAPLTLGEYAPWWFRQQFPATVFTCPRPF